MGGYRIVSSDSHIIEPPDLWTSRIEPRFRDRCPRVETAEGGEVWVIDNTLAGSFIQGTQTGWRFDQPEKLVTFIDTFDNVRPGGYMPDEAIVDMDLDGVDVAILYPTIGFGVYHQIPDTDFLTAVLSAYNDFAAEFCSAHPERLKAIAMLNIDDVQTGVKEMERCAKLGFVGVSIPAYNARLKYDSPEFGPLWASAQDLEMPISLHINSNRPTPDGEFGSAMHVVPLFLVNGDYWPRMSLADMILSGVFERYPKLQVGSAEYETAWAAPFLKRLDYHYSQSSMGMSGYRYKGDMLPSDYFHRNCFLDTQEDALGIRLRDIIGVDNILWGSDYPHIESTFPKSREFLEEMLADCTEEEKAKISGGNADRIYRL